MSPRSLVLEEEVVDPSQLGSCTTTNTTLGSSALDGHPSTLAPVPALPLPSLKS